MKLHLTPSIERGKDTTHQPDNQTMKPTEGQFTIIKQAYLDADTVTRGVAAAIAQWEAVRPKDDTDRWIPLTERRPTEEDADENSWVLVLFSDRTLGALRWNQIGNFQVHTHWCRTNLPPKEPTPEEIEDMEINRAWQDGPDYPDKLDAFKAGWLACKSKGGAK